MDSATQDLFHQRIYELFYDEDKIVTCPSLVCELKISLEEAKTLLMTFVNEKRQLRSTEFCVSYLISGHLKEAKGLALYLVKEEDLDAKKSLFDAIASEIIFSIQKNQLINFNTIASVNKTSIDANPDVCLSSVVSKSCVKRTIKPHNLPLKVEPAPLKEKKSWFQQNTSSNGGSLKTNSSQELAQERQINKTNGSQALSQEKQSKNTRTGSITNFFSKASVKTIESVKAEESKENQIKEEEIAKLESKPEDLKEKISVVVNRNGIKKEKENSVEDMEVEDSDVKIIEQKPKQKITGKKRKQENKNNESNKKRKRIQEMCDSDSSDIFEEEKDEDIIEKSDEESEPITKYQPLTKNKVRKAVDKTYVDEDGYMVTTTEYIYESAPEDGENEVVKSSYKEEPKVIANKKNSTADSELDQKNQKSKAKKNNKNSTTGKQTTLMSFFKKN